MGSFLGKRIQRAFLPSQAGVFPQVQEGVVIIGGGLAAFFTAYNILLLSSDIAVTVIADHTNVPCSSGNQIDFRIDGYFEDNVPADPRMQNILQQALCGIKDVLEREKVSCRFRSGYEVKARSVEEIERARRMLNSAGILTEGFNDAAQILKFPDHPYSLKVKDMGQINMPEFVEAIKQAVIRMGGDVRLGTIYKGHSVRMDGAYEIEMTDGVLVNHRPPLIATGAEHMHKILGNALPGRKLVYTAATVIGPLSAQDAALVASDAMAFCDSHVEGDFVWGSLDPNNMLTIGCGELDEHYRADERLALERKIEGHIDAFGLQGRSGYETHRAFGPMLMLENRMPLVGRDADCDYSGGWGGFGIVPGFAAAQAYAKWVVHRNDADLRLFEELQPAFFRTQISVPKASEQAFMSENIR
jgi:glycine/D-amino acid oxidase-like deaminating enzyme